MRRASRPGPHPNRARLEPKRSCYGADRVRRPSGSRNVPGASSWAGTGRRRPEFAAQIQRAGLVGLGGAAFPTHVKVKVPDGKKVRAVVINGAECEPYLTSDHRVMVEQPDASVRGTRSCG